IAGGPIGDKLLRIEAEAPAAMYEIEEVQDSEDDGSDSGGRVSQAQTTPGSTAATPRLRQLTLLELFCPVE
ncbi:hypothetical protein CC86DRAFT_289513, partial [Ophiobolus disseminans]